MSNQDVKKIIENSFLGLLQERSYEQITVSTIVENAFVSRTTFYNYFKNKDDVLLSVLDDFLSEFDILQKENIDFLNQIDMTSKDSIKTILYPNTLGIIEYFLSKKNFILILLSPKVSIDFMKILQKVYYEHFIQALPDLYYKKIDQEILEYYSLFLTNGVASIVENWFYHNLDESPQKISDKILNLLAVSLQNIYLEIN
ncbi:TetR/AcrR family transcriptional regulator [Enterococcus mundtii]|uniref:TetR/AcrR family transcriptional regulator n=1 Tax=Enterococcus mundtii TaxID=53346 RepID=UPI000E05642D|nr:TetR/AcrR family transcriptional regulator [Enterococcus mundtii]STD21718.1 TetR family transcriptional regulator [Enterococcus mundtii]